MGAQPAQDPPQSMAVSSPFWTPSPQVAARQMASPQTRLSQSAGPTQAKSTGQGTQSPPQSRSVSVPFCTPSSQLAGAEGPRCKHLSQSAASRHSRPGTQAGQDPPRSISASSPLRTPSSQVGAIQSWSVHTPLWQSLGSAGQVRDTGRTIATAVGVGLRAVLHSVVAAGRRTEVVGADATLAIACVRAGRPIGTPRAVAATVHASLGSVLGAIHAVRGRTDRVDTDAALAIGSRGAGVVRWTGSQGPPQSVSVSSPLVTPSSQRGAGAASAMASGPWWRPAGWRRAGTHAVRCH